MGYTEKASGGDNSGKAEKLLLTQERILFYLFKNKQTSFLVMGGRFQFPVIMRQIQKIFLKPFAAAVVKCQQWPGTKSRQLLHLEINISAVQVT